MPDSLSIPLCPRTHLINRESSSASSSPLLVTSQEEILSATFSKSRVSRTKRVRREITMSFISLWLAVLQISRVSCYTTQQRDRMRRRY